MTARQLIEIIIEENHEIDEQKRQALFTRADEADKMFKEMEHAMRMIEDVKPLQEPKYA